MTENSTNPYLPKYDKEDEEKIMGFLHESFSGGTTLYPPVEDLFRNDLKQIKHFVEQITNNDTYKENKQKYEEENREELFKKIFLSNTDNHYKTYEKIYKKEKIN